MKTFINKLGWSAIIGGVFVMAMTFFTSAPAKAQGYYPDDYRYGRPTEQWVRQKGYDTGYQMGLKHGVKDGVEGLRSNHRTPAYNDGLVGFDRAWVHGDNYKRGFREGYLEGYNTGYANYYTYAREWGYYRDNDNYRRGRYNDPYNNNGTCGPNTNPYNRGRYNRNRDRDRDRDRYNQDTNYRRY